jgi:hypothetical protein
MKVMQKPTRPHHPGELKNSIFLVHLVAVLHNTFKSSNFAATS